MGYCYDNMVKPKRYIQYNDLVFMGRKSIDSQSESISLRESKTARTFSHGSYVANRGEMSYISDNSISLQIALRTNQWYEEHIQAHYEFIMQQLMTPGKLWAILPGHQLVWANAYVTSIQHKSDWVATDDGFLVFSVEFDNPGGVWYKADETKTFLEDYSHCDFLAMKASCLGKHRLCCNDTLNCYQGCECCEDSCADMGDMVDFCTMQSDMQFYNDFFEECNSKWRVVYNCEKARLKGKDAYPHTICDVCVNDTLTGSFLSLTNLTTKKWSIALMGIFKDPVIYLNDNKMELSGDYNGVITMNYKGEIRYAKSWECIEYAYDEIDLSQLNMCDSTPYVKSGRNTVSVSGVVGDYACIYIDYERVTV